MPRIVGVNIPDNKQIIVALTYIYGIGYSSSEKILSLANVEKTKRASQLTSEEANRIQMVIKRDYKTEGELRRERLSAIKRLKDVRCWRGIRHAMGLPVRGQRTRSNSRTVRGNVRRTTISGKRKAPAPK